MLALPANSSPSSPTGFCFCARVADGRDGPRGTRRARRSPLSLLPPLWRRFASLLLLLPPWPPSLPSWLLLSIPRDHPHLFFARHHMARALRRDAHIRTAGTGRTSPPVRRRDPFPACRSTRGVRRRKSHSKLHPPPPRGAAEASSVGPASVLPPSAGDGGNENAIRYTWRTGFFPSDDPRGASRAPRRPTVSGARGTVFAGASKPARPRRFPCRRATSSRRVVFSASGRQKSGRAGGHCRRGRSASRSVPPVTSGPRRASATHPTRLETRTEESWPFASRRGHEEPRRRSESERARGRAPVPGEVSRRKRFRRGVSRFLPPA